MPFLHLKLSNGFFPSQSKSRRLKITDKVLTWSLATFLITLPFVHSSTDSWPLTFFEYNIPVPVSECFALFSWNALHEILVI